VGLGWTDRPFGRADGFVFDNLIGHRKRVFQGGKKKRRLSALGFWLSLRETEHWLKTDDLRPGGLFRELKPILNRI
jgi:hypothetical protein